MDRYDELESKDTRVQALLDDQGLDALLLSRVSSFAWVTGGAASYVNTATDIGAATVLWTPHRKYVITDNIEAPRLRAEEGLKDLGFKFKVAPWYEKDDVMAELTAGLKLGADTPYPGAVDVSTEVGALRARLTPAEGERFRQLGRLCADAVQAAVRAITPGQTEYEIAAQLAAETLARGVLPTVNLIATDERIFNFRHPLPTDRRLERYVMLVLCGRKWGLVCSVTRLVHFGSLPEELQRKMEAVARIDATFIAATRPGGRIADIFQKATQTYAEAGFPDEWQRHHQGGAAGYQPREYVATLDSQEIVHEGQAFAWNPSITGTKSEDTILVGPEANEILTATDDWPMAAVEVRGQAIPRPEILVV
ncbi:MAG: M24 family metallopeptidase [Anaerolineae bacterium]